MANSPDELSFTLLSLPSFQETSVFWHDGEILFSGQGGTSNYQPSISEWETFWGVLDRLHAWDWEPDYVDRGVLDGVQWAFSVTREGRAIRCHGSNAFPPGFRVLQGAINLLVKGALSGDGFTESPYALLGAAETAGQVHAGPEAAVPALIQALRDAEWNESGLKAAAEGLGKLGRHAVPAIPTLLEALATSYGVYLAYAGRDALAVIAGDLARADPEEQRRLARPVLTPVVAALTERKLATDIRSSLVTIVKAAGLDQPGAMTALLACLGDPDRGVFDAARYVLRDMNPRPPEAVAILLESLRARLVEKYGFASEILQALKLYEAATAERALPILLAALDLPDEEARARAVEGLSELGPAARGAIPRLIAGLTDANDTTQWRSAETLGNIGPEARSAVPALIGQLETGKYFVRWRAATALGKIGDPAAIPALVVALTTDDSEVAQRAGHALRDLGPAVVAAVPALVRILSVLDGPGHSTAAGVLESLGPPASAAIPALLAALSGGKSEWGRLACAQALAAIDPEMKTVSSALLKALADPSVDVRLGVAKVLRKSNHKPGAVVPVLAAIAQGKESSWVRAEAIDLLRELGPEARSAIPTLQLAAGDPEESVREAAKKALQAIQGAADVPTTPAKSEKKPWWKFW
jgi:HEAT repeat protein